MKKRSMMALAMGALMAASMAAPAAADRPDQSSDSAEGDVVDPCTGYEMEVTLDIVRFEHSHKNNFVGRIETTGTTTSGHVVVGGHDNIQENDNVEILSFKVVLRNPFDGSMYEVAGYYRSTGNGYVDEFGLRCIGAPTIVS